MEAWLLKYWSIISWCVGGILTAGCTIHGSVLIWLLKLISKKVGRPEFENRVSNIEQQVSTISSQVLEIYEQNGKIVAGLKALEEASLAADKNIKEHIDRLEKGHEMARLRSVE